MSIFPTHMLTNSLTSCVCNRSGFPLIIINIYTQFPLMGVLKEAPYGYELRHIKHFLPTLHV
jgi:hypothetical protein